VPQFLFSIRQERTLHLSDERLRLPHCLRSVAILDEIALVVGHETKLFGLVERLAASSIFPMKPGRRTAHAPWLSRSDRQ